jgi:hypothetical protein
MFLVRPGTTATTGNAGTSQICLVIPVIPVILLEMVTHVRSGSRCPIQISPTCKVARNTGNMGTDNGPKASISDRAKTLRAVPRNTSSAHPPACQRARRAGYVDDRCGCPGFGWSLLRCQTRANGSSVRHFGAKSKPNSTFELLDFPSVYPIGGSR